jgi:hypothetical protein
MSVVELGWVLSGEGGQDDCAQRVYTPVTCILFAQLMCAHAAWRCDELCSIQRSMHADNLRPALCSAAAVWLPSCASCAADCSFLADRVQVAAGVTITLQHMLLSRCSIGQEKPMMIFQFDQGSRLVVADTYLLQPDNLCLPLQTQSGSALHRQRPAGIQGPLQSIELGQPQQWCARSSGTRTAADGILARNSDGDGRAAGLNVDPSSGVKDNNSYSVLPPLPQEFANRTGLGPAYAATLDQPASNRYYVHPT